MVDPRKDFTIDRSGQPHSLEPMDFKWQFFIESWLDAWGAGLELHGGMK